MTKKNDFVSKSYGKNLAAGGERDKSLRGSFKEFERKHSGLRDLFKGLKEEYGGKGLNLRIMDSSGIRTPPTHFQEDVDKLEKVPDIFIVRSSSEREDGMGETGAGRYESIPNVKPENLKDAVRRVRSQYLNGNVVIQPDITEEMEYSGVCYTTLDEGMFIRLGSRDSVHQIVENSHNEAIEIIVRNGRLRKLRGDGPVPPQSILGNIIREMERIEKLFSTPMDVEFAVVNGQVYTLQARPIPLKSVTSSTYESYEEKKLDDIYHKYRSLGYDGEVIFGAGNYREILGGDYATPLSVDIFNYVFTGDGKDKLGAVQLGRNELGYEVGYEIYPWVIYYKSGVYYNFIGDALQFRPRGLSLDNMLKIVGRYYLPYIRGNPDLINYPELGLYIQSNQDLERLSIPMEFHEPFHNLIITLDKELMKIDPPIAPPKRKLLSRELETASLTNVVERLAYFLDIIRQGSAKEYVKAARLAFYALERVRVKLEILEYSAANDLNDLRSEFETLDLGELRDKIVYDESIKSFEVSGEEYKYLGSFELSLERSFPPQRHMRKGRELPPVIAEDVEIARLALENREKVKFFLFRDLDMVRQCILAIGDKTGLKDKIFYLNLEKIFVLGSINPFDRILTLYNLSYNERCKERFMMERPMSSFSFDGRLVEELKEKEDVKLIFGKLGEGMVLERDEILFVGAVDQTIEIPEKKRLIIVTNNIKPGSHLFTLLSDYELPVISVDLEMFDKLKEGMEKNIKFADGKEVVIE